MAVERPQQLTWQDGGQSLNELAWRWWMQMEASSFVCGKGADRDACRLPRFFDSYHISCGYFIWDTVDAIVNFVDIGFAVHGLACLAIYLGSFKPFLAYYAARCLLWEASNRPTTANVHISVSIAQPSRGLKGPADAVADGALLLRPQMESFAKDFICAVDTSTGGVLCEGYRLCSGYVHRWGPFRKISPVQWYSVVTSTGGVLCEGYRLCSGYVHRWDPFRKISPVQWYSVVTSAGGVLREGSHQSGGPRCFVRRQSLSRRSLPVSLFLVSVSSFSWAKA